MLLDNLDKANLIVNTANTTVGVVAHNPHFTTAYGSLLWFVAGLAFVYLEIWMKPDVDESLFAPCYYAKKHPRSVVFALLSYVAIFSLWLTSGLYFEVNNATLIDLPKGQLNALVFVIAYVSSSLFTALVGKYMKLSVTPKESLDESKTKV
jgi:hypothetical protein